MTQIILDATGYNVILPESQKGGYHAQKTPLSVDVEMISGRLVRELRGEVWRVYYQYGYFNDDQKNAVIAACEKGKARTISCGILLPNGGEQLYYNDFFVVSFTYPKFFWSRLKDGAPVALWGDFSLELREVKPNA